MMEIRKIHSFQVETSKRLQDPSRYMGGQTSARMRTCESSSSEAEVRPSLTSERRTPEPPPSHAMTGPDVLTTSVCSVPVAASGPAGVRALGWEQPPERLSQSAILRHLLFICMRLAIFGFRCRK